MFKKIVMIVVVLLALFLGYAATKPNTFHVERRIAITVPPEKIFPFVNDYHNWALWSPWEKLDPNMKRTYNGPASGKGAVYEWAGNKEVGEGRMEITDSIAPSMITIAMHFIKPFEGRNIAEFTLQPKDGSTEVVWAMYGPQPFMCKVMSTFFNMNQMIGKEFETGLANLKTIVEK